MSDPFLEVAGLLFGDGADELVAKMNPVGTDLSAAEKDKRKRKITAGLSAVGAAAGGAGLALGTHNLSRSYKTARGCPRKARNILSPRPRVPRRRRSRPPLVTRNWRPG